ncbi:MAG: F0F1 ATP synthase subunit delta [Proteobacteria bacterium]|nr:F0F1 ATP synthase subunit delta [Pseudomonadota bacterium]
MDLKERSLARRYARGLVDAAAGLAGLAEQMSSLAEACGSVPGLVRALSDERRSFAARSKMASACAKEIGLSREAESAVLLMIKKGRAKLIPLVAEEAVEMIFRIEGKQRAKLRVAEASLAGDIRSRVEGALSASTGMKVECDVDVDPSLMAGFDVRLGDMHFDASAAGRLSRLRGVLYSHDKER